MWETRNNFRAARNGADKIRVALIGVGNGASSLVPGGEFYKNARVGEHVPGLMHVELGGWHIRDIEFTAAFDINENFMNMLERERLESKMISKTRAVTTTDQTPIWEAPTRHKESEGSAYYRHFYLGLIRADGTPKPALKHFNPELGICQWFHFEDHRLDFAVDWLKKLGVKKLRTGISWADWHHPNALEWFDRQMKAIEDFDVTVTLCFTPPSRGKVAHCTSPPFVPGEFAEFASAVVQRYVADPANAQVKNGADAAMLVSE